MAQKRWAHIASQNLTSTNISSITEAHSTIVRLCANGQLQEALSLFYAQKSQPHSQTYATLLQTCARHRSLAEGRALHRHILTRTHVPDLFVSNHLINMYAKCGDLDYAHQVFDEIPQRNLVTWTALITGYDQCGRADECFRLFARMISHHIPNEFALASVLRSCAGSRDGSGGRQVHGLALKTSFDGYVYVANALITMYSSSDDNVCDGWLVFQTMPSRNLISWNSMISGFEMQGIMDRSIKLFIMMQRDGIGFDHATLVSVIASCYDEQCCHQLHSVSAKTNFVAEPEVATALVKAYSKFGGNVQNCYKVFSEITHRDIVSWTGIITSCAEQEPEDALVLFCQLRKDGFDPDRHTLSIVIKACSCLAIERHSSTVHSQIIKSGFGHDLVLGNALIHAYARCGSIGSSELIFDHMQVRDIVSWNSMIKAYAVHGKCYEAIQVFNNMDVKPDAATFVGLLSACSHAGHISKGLEIFDSMSKNYGIAPQRDHFTCMVDILARAGHLTEAEDLITRMPMEPDRIVWSSLLASCKKHGNSEIGERAARKLIVLDPENSIGYVSMYNLYYENGDFDNAGSIRKEMRESGTKKEPGLSWIEIGNRTHEFAAGGRRHPMRDAIYRELKGLMCRLKDMGYVPETSLVLQEEQLYNHSEKLALAFGLMNGVGSSSSSSSIRIMKNIRVCVDCHNFMKIASSCIGKEIVVRDANRFHHFCNGVCSCSDYW